MQVVSNYAKHSTIRKTAQRTHEGLRVYLELTQDIIVLGLCLMLFVGMLIKLAHLGPYVARH